SIGGLVGRNLGTVQTSYATGAVSGPSNLGGLVGNNTSGPIAGTVTDSYWDTQTSGQATSAGGAGATGLTTAALQTGGLPAGFSSSIWGGGSGGLYPFLQTFYPNGVQAVSGIAYKDAGLTVAASGASGAVPVTVL